MFNKTLFATCLAALTCVSAALVASPVQVAGTVGDVPFPDRSRSYLSEGDFVSIENLRQMRPGLGKDQVRILLGNPHFKEGLVGVREWNYIFNFRTGTGDEYITCQYQVRYGKDDGDERPVAKSLHWDDSACLGLLNAPPPAAADALAGNERKYLLSSNLLFGFDRWGINDIVPPGRDELEALAAEIVDSNVSSLKIIGHTDRIGSDADNQRLSERRAGTVRDYLVDRGVEAEKMLVEGRGEREPVKDCRNLPRSELIRCLAPNRRVEIVVTGTSL